jgi:hypothetical protein
VHEVKNTIIKSKNFNLKDCREEYWTGTQVILKDKPFESSLTAFINKKKKKNHLF